jgi:hypothetical protein
MAVTGWKDPGTAASVDRDSKASWANPDYAKVSDSSRAQCTIASGPDYGDWLRLTNFGFSSADIPSGATIDGIEIQIQQKGSFTNYVKDSSIYLRKTSGQVGSNGASASYWSTSEGYVTRGGASSLWGTTWADTDITSSNFGIDISIQTVGGTNQYGLINDVQIRVYYTDLTLTIAGAGGIASAEAIGSAKIVQQIKAAGIATAEALGSAKVVYEIKGAGGIDTAEAFGSPAVVQIIKPAGIVSEEAFGSPQVIQILSVQTQGILSEEAFGLPTIIQESDYSMMFKAWANLPIAKRIYLVETSAKRMFDAYDIFYLYLSNHPIAFSDRQYVPCVSGVPSLTREMNDTLTANSVPTWGDLEILIDKVTKPDSENSISWNWLLSEYYNFLGRDIVILVGGEDWAYEDFRVIFQGKIGGQSHDEQYLTWTLYDKGAELERKELPSYVLPDLSSIPESNRGSAIPVPLGRVRFYQPILINESTGLWGLSAGIINDILSCRLNGIVTAYTWEQKDISPVYPDDYNTGSAVMVATGPYTGALTEVVWLIEIDSITTENSEGDYGPEIGLATFQWSTDNGVTWTGTGLLTWHLEPDTIAKAPYAGIGTLTLGGDYTGDRKLTYKVKVTTGGDIGDVTPPAIVWSDDNGDTWSDPVDLTEDPLKPGYSETISFNRNLTAVFYGGSGVWTNNPQWQKDPTSLGDMTISSIDSGLDAALLEVIITTGGQVGDGLIKYKWQYDSGGWTTGQDIPTDDPIELFTGLSVQFSTAMSLEDYHANDQWINIPSYTPAFPVDDTWTWTFKETPISLADGVSIQFTGGTGDDFAVGDAFSFILISTITVGAGDSKNDLTVDVEGRVSAVTGAYAYTAGDIIQDLLQTVMGWADDELDLDSFADFIVTFPYTVGFLIDKPTSITEIIDSLLEGIPAFYSIDLDGLFYIRELTAPSGVSVATLTDVELLVDEEFTSEVTSDDIYRRIYLNYDKCWSTIGSGDDIPKAHYEWAKNEWRICRIKDDSVLDDYPLAKDLGPIDSCIIVKASTEAIAEKLLDLHGAKRQTLKIACKAQPFTWKIGDVVTIQRNSWGLYAGVKFRVIGMDLDFETTTSTLTLWR